MKSSSQAVTGCPSIARWRSAGNLRSELGNLGPLLSTAQVMGKKIFVESFVFGLLNGSAALKPIFCIQFPFSNVCNAVDFIYVSMHCLCTVNYPCIHISFCHYVYQHYSINGKTVKLSWIAFKFVFEPTVGWIAKRNRENSPKFG